MEGTKHLTPRYSQMALGLADDILGPILADGSKPDFISFGGGLPCPEGFPVEALREASDWCLKTYPSRSLQYSGPEGEPELREQIAAYETSRGNPTSPDEILVTSGSQQALDLCGRVFCDPGSKILIQRPSYIGALSTSLSRHMLRCRLMLKARLRLKSGKKRAMSGLPIRLRLTAIRPDRR